MLNRIFSKTPLPSMTYGLIERVLSASRLNEIFEQTAEKQYTKELLFSEVCTLLLRVVLKEKSSIHVSYRDSEETLGVSLSAVYDKLNKVEPAVSAALVTRTYEDLRAVQQSMGYQSQPLLPGYHVRLLDGNNLAPTQKRLKALRSTRSGALPGKSLVVLNPDEKLISHVIPCEDAYVQERVLLKHIIPLVEQGQLWIADRNFCTTTWLNGVDQQQGKVLIRQHSQLNFTAKTVLEEAPEHITEDGQRIREHLVVIEDREYRRIQVDLPKTTRSGENTLFLLTDVPHNKVDAAKLATLYRQRWLIETVFQRLEAHLNSEMNTLGYPQAGLLGFCLAVLALNAYHTVMCALDCHHQEPVSEQLSTYYMAEEMEKALWGFRAFTDTELWQEVVGLSAEAFGQWLLEVAACVNLRRYRKTSRGPKKPKVQTPYDPTKPHVSTARLLAQAKAKKKTKGEGS